MGITPKFPRRISLQCAINCNVLHSLLRWVFVPAWTTTPLSFCLVRDIRFPFPGSIREYKYYDVFTLGNSFISAKNILKIKFHLSIEFLNNGVWSVLFDYSFRSFPWRLFNYFLGNEVSVLLLYCWDGAAVWLWHYFPGVKMLLLCAWVSVYRFPFISRVNECIRVYMASLVNYQSCQ